jgi:hypothetical protein
VRVERFEMPPHSPFQIIPVFSGALPTVSVTSNLVVTRATASDVGFPARHGSDAALAKRLELGLRECGAACHENADQPRKGNSTHVVHLNEDNQNSR